MKKNTIITLLPFYNTAIVLFTIFMLTISKTIYHEIFIISIFVLYSIISCLIIGKEDKEYFLVIFNYYKVLAIIVGLALLGTIINNAICNIDIAPVFIGFICNCFLYIIHYLIAIKSKKHKKQEKSI